MGRLDEPAFERAIAACPGCGGTTFEIAAYLDHQLAVMLGETDRPGKWAHDGEKFVDGVYRVTCANAACKHEVFASGDCPRCHRAGGLADALGAQSRLVVPKKCPKCKELELVLLGFAPAVVRVTAGGRVPAPTPLALLGEVGFHAVAVACDPCGWAVVAENCPLCAAPGPLRARP
jgi:hypothetical protein